MSQKAMRKGIVQEDKDKGQTDSPVKDMKKKMAANAEKEKQATEKTAEKLTEKPTEKNTNKTEKTDKHEKIAEKKAEKPVEKKTDAPSESPKDDSKGEKSGKSNQEQKKTEQTKPKQNGKSYNGVSDLTLNANGGAEDALNGRVSPDSEGDDAMLVIDDDDHHDDELFPELTYDDTSDAECFESPTPENVPSRSYTRRSQVKVTRTPETPRPASEKPSEKEGPSDESKDKDSKILKMKEDAAAASTDRKLRSADSPKPAETKKQDRPQEKDDKAQESPKKAPEKTPEAAAKGQEKKGKEESPKKKDKEESPKKKDSMVEEGKENGEKPFEMDVEIIIEDGNQDEPRKTDTNYSKSRVKVSPYRRSMRLADQTTSSVMANYTGNNTTMEMDITESSLVSEEQSLDDSSYLSGLRSIRGRRSYKPLKEMSLRHLTNRSVRSTASLNVSEPTFRPTAPVVGRKRKPDADEAVEVTELASEAEELTFGRTKRMRLLERIAHPFRMSLASTPLPRRAAEIVGLNTDFPLAEPVASPPESLDPEAMKSSTSSTTETLPTPTVKVEKRCIVM